MSSSRSKSAPLKLIEVEQSLQLIGNSINHLGGSSFPSKATRIAFTLTVARFQGRYSRELKNLTNYKLFCQQPVADF